MFALPMNRHRLARHFTKSAQIAFYNERFEQVMLLDNPAVAGGCAAKKAMLNLIKSHGVKTVLVDQIGERMLGKLLASGMVVSQGDCRLSVEDLLAASLCSDTHLTAANQGRASLNHAKKGGCGGGCGCHGHDKDKDKQTDSKPSLLLAPTVGAAELTSISGLTRL